jgi:hypothetical protein
MMTLLAIVIGRGSDPRCDVTQVGQTEGAVMRAYGRTAGVLLIALAAIGLLLGFSTQALAADVANNWFNAAGPLNPGAKQVSAIDTVGDTDWFYFYTSQAGEVKIGINWDSGDHTALHLYRWDGGDLVSCGDIDNNVGYGNGSLFDQSLPAGLYYAQLSGYSDSSVGGYDFTVSGLWVTAASPYVSFVMGSSATLKRMKAYAFYGYAYPVPVAALRVFKYRSSTRKYMAYKTCPAAVSFTGTPRRFVARWKPTQTGRYRLYWQTRGPAGMIPGQSGYRYVKVK